MYNTSTRPGWVQKIDQVAQAGAVPGIRHRQPGAVVRTRTVVPCSSPRNARERSRARTRQRYQRDRRLAMLSRVTRNERMVSERVVVVAHRESNVRNMTFD